MIESNIMTLLIDYCGCCYKLAILIVGQQLDSHKWEMKVLRQVVHVDFHCSRMDYKECSSIVENFQHQVVADSYKEAFPVCLFRHNYYDYHLDLHLNLIV